MALTHRRTPWVTDSRHNSKLQPNHTKHKHTNSHTTPRKPATYLTTTITNTLQRNADWATMQALSSDHLPILITYKTKTNYKIQQHRRTYTNYNKANWQEFTQEIEQTVADSETTKLKHRNKNTNQRHTRLRQTPHTGKGEYTTHKLLPKHTRNMENKTL